MRLLYNPAPLRLGQEGESEDDAEVGGEKKRETKSKIDSFL